MFEALEPALAYAQVGQDRARVREREGGSETSLHKARGRKAAQQAAA